jgi:hypothetical protein
MSYRGSNLGRASPFQGAEQRLDLAPLIFCEREHAEMGRFARHGDRGTKEGNDPESLLVWFERLDPEVPWQDPARLSDDFAGPPDQEDFEHVTVKACEVRLVLLELDDGSHRNTLSPIRVGRTRWSNLRSWTTTQMVNGCAAQRFSSPTARSTVSPNQFSLARALRDQPVNLGATTNAGGAQEPEPPV